MKNFGNAKRFALEGDDDLLIEALAPVEGRDEYRSIVFRESRIDYLFAFDEKLSGIVLDNGITIPVALAFSDLKQRIYNNDFDTGGSIDLTLVTGKPVSDEKALLLSKKFNPAAEVPAPAPATGSSREIVVFAHGDPTDRKFRLLRFREADIGHFEPHADRKDRETYVQLKPGVNVEGWTRFYVPCPMHYFTWYLAEAQKKGWGVLDMTEHTRPKDSASLKMD